MANRVTVGQFTGHEFAQVVQCEFARHNKGLASLSIGDLARSCGLNRRTVRLFLSFRDEGGLPNPSLKTMRLVLFTLGFKIRAPESDVIPHLEEKEAFREDLHGDQRPRKDLCLSDLGEVA